MRIPAAIINVILGTLLALAVALPSSNRWSERMAGQFSAGGGGLQFVRWCCALHLALCLDLGHAC